MNIVHINLADHHGGAAMAAFRLHQAMRRAGHDSRMLVWRKYTDDPNVEIFEKHTVLRALSQTVGKQLDGLGFQYLYHPASMRLPEHPWIKRADIINLHQLHGSYFSFRVLPKLSRIAPIVWTMHDMWAVTGHCASAAWEQCDRWQVGCGHCPHKDDVPPIRGDLTALIWKAKNRAYKRSRIDVVSPSQWMANRLQLSPLLDQLPIHHLANGVDPTIFRPLDKQTAREALGIHPEKKIIMFGAASLSEPRKGAHLLQAALSSMPAEVKKTIMLLLVGGRHNAVTSNMDDFDIKTLGQVQNEALLAIAYAAADIFVLASLAENLPNMLVESLACGTPCVTFDVGGCSEIVEDGRTGYLAKAGDVDDLAVGICSLLRDDAQRLVMGEAGVHKAHKAFDVNVQAGRYLLQYERCLNPR
ncbi:MAG: glycosyltransferase [Chloroflexi bacterium]|nr:glycosyltransferase [Chloroflexota bacterium]